MPDMKTDNTCKPSFDKVIDGITNGAVKASALCVNDGPISTKVSNFE